MTARFKFLEHTADAFVEAYGASLEEAFESAGMAFTDVMTTLETVEPKIESSFVLEAQDEEALLYSWLEELLLEFELKEMLYSRFQVSEITKTDEGFKLAAKAWGEVYDPSRHVSKVGVKAATYHQMKIVKDSGGVVLRFLLDI
ncbi:MAG: archease [Candidatus Bathyarchaeota archaeon]|jgi:SHS2 domain-containing protein|nr:archease [Candidatus Bathyarchaeota archaeon]